MKLLSACSWLLILCVSAAAQFSGFTAIPTHPTPGIARLDRPRRHHHDQPLGRWRLTISNQYMHDVRHVHRYDRRRQHALLLLRLAGRCNFDNGAGGCQRSYAAVRVSVRPASRF